MKEFCHTFMEDYSKQRNKPGTQRGSIRASLIVASSRCTHGIRHRATTGIAKSGSADQGGQEAHRPQDRGDVYALCSHRGQAGARCGRVGGESAAGDYRDIPFYEGDSMTTREDACGSGETQRLTGWLCRHPRWHCGVTGCCAPGSGAQCQCADDGQLLGDWPPDRRSRAEGQAAGRLR